MSTITIAQMSDLHCGSQHFVPSLLERAIAEINELQPDAVIVSGDLTADGFRRSSRPRAVPRSLRCERLIVIPGNHDSRNVGYVHFEELFGDALSVPHDRGVRSSPSTPRSRTSTTARSAAAATAGSRVLRASRPTCACSCSTTTCCRCRVPGASATWCTTRATRSNACSARLSTWCCRATSTCHTRGGWRTCSWSTRARSRPQRLRGKTKPCYNLIEASPERVTVYRKYPFHEQDAILTFDPGRTTTRSRRACSARPPPDNRQRDRRFAERFTWKRI